MIDSNNKLKTLSKSLIESARKIMTEKKSQSDLAKLAPPKDKVTHADVLVGRGVYTHDQVKAHKAKKGIKEDADMVVVNAPVLADINGELAEVLKRDPRDKTVHIQLEGMKYILKKGQYEELPEAVKNPYAVGMAAAMKATGDEPPLKKSTITKAHEIAKKVAEEVEELGENFKRGDYIHVPGGNNTKHPAVHLGKKAVYLDDEGGVEHVPDSALAKATKMKKVSAHHKNLGSKYLENMKEDAEQIAELSKGTLASYIKKAGGTTLSGAPALAYEAGRGEKGKFAKSVKRAKGVMKAVDKLTKEEVEQIDELSKDTVSKYANKAFDQSNSILKSRNLDLPKSVKKSAEDAKERRRKGIVSAGKRLGDDEMKKISQASANRIVYNKEDVEFTQEELNYLNAVMADLDEGRGRPPKEGSAAWHAKQKQDLADMPALSVQIRKASSMNKPVTFMDGKSHEISQHHIDKFHDHMDARKTTQDKAAFQKKAHASHDEFKKAVSEPIPGHSKDTGEIVKYR